MATEILQKSRATITAQSNGVALTAAYDPNSGSYTGSTPAVIDNTYDGGSENSKGAEFLNLELNVTSAPSTATSAQIWFCTSENGTNYTRWQYAQTVPESILSTGAARYNVGLFVLTAQYTKLAVVAVSYAFTAALYATPKLMELQ